MTYIIRVVQGIEDDEGVLERALAAVFAKFDGVAVQVEQVRFEPHAIEMEEAREVSGKRLLLVGIEAL